MTTWREKLLGSDDGPNRRRGLTVRLADGVLGSVLRAKTTITNLISFNDDRESPSGKQGTFDRRLPDHNFFETAPGSQFDDSPGRYPKLPKRRSLFEHDPWSSSPERQDSPKGFLGSSIGRRRRTGHQAESRWYPPTEGRKQKADNSNPAAEKDVLHSSPVNILPPRLPSPGLLSLIELERKEWLLDGNRRPEGILKPAHFRRLKSDVEVLTERAEDTDSFPPRMQPKLSNPMPGTNLPLFSPNEDSFETVRTFPGDYFGRLAETLPPLPPRPEPTADDCVSSSSSIATERGERHRGPSESSSCCFRNDSAVGMSSDLLRSYQDYADQDASTDAKTKDAASQPAGIAPREESGNEFMADLDLTGVCPTHIEDAFAEAKAQHLRSIGSSHVNGIFATEPEEMNVRNMPTHMDSMAPDKLSESASLLLGERGDSTHTDTAELDASPVPNLTLAGPTKEVCTSTPRDTKGVISPPATRDDSPFSSPTMGSRGMFEKNRAERRRRYQKLLARYETVGEVFGTEPPPPYVEQASLKVQAIDTPVSSPPSSAPSTPLESANAKPLTEFSSQPSAHEKTLKYKKGGKRTRRYRQDLTSSFPLPLDTAEIEILAPASPKVQTTDPPASCPPSSAPITPLKSATAKSLTESLPQPSEHEKPLKEERRGKRPRKYRQGLTSPSPSPLGTPEIEILAPASLRLYDRTNRSRRAVPVNAFDHSSLSTRLRQVTPLTIIRLDDLDSEDIDRPFVAARLPLFRPPDANDDVEAEASGNRATESSMVVEPRTPRVHSASSPATSYFATPDVSDIASPCPVHHPAPYPGKLDAVPFSTLTAQLDGLASSDVISGVYPRKAPPNPIKSDYTGLPSVPEWLESHNFHKNAKGLEDVGWPELVTLDNRGLLRRGVGPYAVRKKILKELRGIVSRRHFEMLIVA